MEYVSPWTYPKAPGSADNHVKGTPERIPEIEASGTVDKQVRKSLEMVPEKLIRVYC